MLWVQMMWLGRAALEENLDAVSADEVVALEEDLGAVDTDNMGMTFRWPS